MGFLFGLLFLTCCEGSSNEIQLLPEFAPTVERACNPAPRKILFVGNSLTFTNDLPLMVEKRASAWGIPIGTDMLAFPNYALEDHWFDGEMEKLIRTCRYEFVIVQQGPSSQGDGLEMLLNYGSKIKNLCDQYDTKLVFFMVWPAKINYHTFPGVIRNYTEAAGTTSSLLCPVGKAWNQHMDATGDFSYYGPDGFHPSIKGSELAARMLVETMYP